VTTSSPFVRLLRRLAASADYALNVRAVMLAALVIAVSAGTSQAEPILRKTGSLAVPADAGIMVFSSDPDSS
jgi:electron transfer flavoprotein alpha/beta subunit